MYYSRSRSPASYSDAKGYSSYGKGHPFNYSSDFTLSSLPPRNPSIQRVLNSDFGISERSRSPTRDYNSPVSRITAFRPLPNVLSTDTSPSLRRRDLVQNNALSEARSSPINFISEDLSYSPKSRNYFDFPSNSVGLFTSYTTIPIKKPQRIDYSDYLRPVLTARPMLKSGYVPKSRAEREGSEIPIIRERKLIKFRETTKDILSKTRRKISWDLPEEISSPLIDEMKQTNCEHPNETSVSEQKKSRESSTSRQGSNDVISRSSVSGSPRPSITRRSSGDHVLDGLSGTTLIRRYSPRSNGFVLSPGDNNFNSSDSKPDFNLNIHAKAPIAPPRKKSIGSTHKSKKTRKSSIETLLSEEKSLNFSKIADDIRRSREISDISKPLNKDVLSDTRQSHVDQDVLISNWNDADSRSQSNANELNALKESTETLPERGRRRRRRESKTEPCAFEEKSLETRTRRRSRFRSEGENDAPSYSLTDSKQVLTNIKYEDTVPQPANRMHRKSVKYKLESVQPRKNSKCSDMIIESSVSSLNDQKTLEFSPDQKPKATKTPEIMNILQVSDVKKQINNDKMPQIHSKKMVNTDNNLNDVSKIVLKQKISAHSNLKPENLCIHKNVDSISVSKELSSVHSVAPKPDTKVMQKSKFLDIKINETENDEFQKPFDVNNLKPETAKLSAMPLNKKEFNIETKNAEDKMLFGRKDFQKEPVKQEFKDQLTSKTSNIEIKSRESKESHSENDSNICPNIENLKPFSKIDECATKTEEIVVVCKLPHPKKLAKTSTSIPKQQNIVVSIVKNSALKTTDVKENNNEVPKIAAPKAQLIIPAKPISDSKPCDKINKIDTPEVNVTHTIILKPKMQNIIPAAQNLKSMKDIEDGMHLKPIPDVIKSTVRSNAKSENVSDIVSGTLSTGDDPLTVKNFLPDIKSDAVFSKGSQEGSSCIAPENNEKATSNLKSEIKSSFQVKPVCIVNNLIPPKQSKDSSKISAKTSLSISSDLKEKSNEKVVRKPDIIQMITHATEKDSKIVSDNKKPISDDKVLKVHTDQDKSNTFKDVGNFQVNDNESKYCSLPNISKQNTGNICNSEFLHLEVKSTSQKDKSFDDSKSLVQAKAGSISFEEQSDSILKSKTMEQVKCVGESQINASKLASKVDTNSLNTSDTLKVETKDLQNEKQISVDDTFQNKEKPLNQKPGDTEKMKLPEVETIDTDNKSTEDMKSKISNKKKLNPENEKTSKRTTPEYKKSLTLPSVLIEPNAASKVNAYSYSNDQKCKTELSSLSSGNIPITLQETVIAKNVDYKYSRDKQESPLDPSLKSKWPSNETSSFERNKDNALQIKFVQVPELGVREMTKFPPKQPDSSLNTAFESHLKEKSENIDATEQTDIKDSVIAEKISFDKNENIIVNDEPKPTDTQNIEKAYVKEIAQKIVDCPASPDSMQPSKVLTETLKAVDKSLDENKNFLKILNINLENSIPSPYDNSSLEVVKDKEKSESLKLLLLDSEEVDSAKKCGDDVTSNKINSLTIQDANLKDSHLPCIDSTKEQEIILNHTLKEDAICKSIAASETKCLKTTNMSLDNDISTEISIPNTSEKTSYKAKTEETQNYFKGDQAESKINISSLQKQFQNEVGVTNEYSPSKPKKTKELKPKPAPPPYRRIGLFLRPKEPTETIRESSSSSSSSSSEDSETESESSTGETLPVNKLPSLTNGKSPDKGEKTRTRSDTSNASIYSNSTTCTTFSTSSLDDEYGSPTRGSNKSKTLKFRKYNIDDFSFLKLLGKGSFGKVLLAELKDNEMYFAIKCLRKDVVLEDDDVESTMIERRVLALGTQHPYMCKLYCTFQSKSYLYFVMEYLNGGDLMFHIQESRRFEEKRALFYGAEIVSALKFLHKRGIVYRDIKLDNVMLDEQGHVRLVDFGMCQCRVYREECMPSNFCGTPTYIAPEIILGQKYNQSVDWWSFGVLLYEMLTGRSPFHGTDEDELFWSICNEEPHYPRFLSKEATHIFGLLFTKSPTKRLGMTSCPAGDIKDHAFFSTINWDKIEKKQVPPPFKPSVSSPCDTSNFDSSFTMDSATLSPVDNEVLESMDQEQFDGFSYTNPHITV